jgi:hypothetical protein
MLAEIYVELSGGREQALGLNDQAEELDVNNVVPFVRPKRAPRPTPQPLLSTPEERERHQLFVAGFGAPTLWPTY